MGGMGYRNWIYMLRCTKVECVNCFWTMEMEFGWTMVLLVLRAVMLVGALAGLTLFFKPLLWGIARALMLACAPRLSAVREK